MPPLTSRGGFFSLEKSPEIPQNPCEMPRECPAANGVTRMSIKTVKTRKALSPANEPYWESIGHGKTLGYRVAKNGMGTWVAKLVRQGERRRHTIGDLSHIPEADQYHAALSLANEWFMANGQKASGATVGVACRIYIDRRDNAIDTSRYQVLIKGDPIEKILLARLTEADVKAWDLRHRSGLRTPYSKKPIEKRTASINRQRTFLRAALNAALAAELVATDAAWKNALKALPTPKGETVNRDLCLTREECAALLQHCRPDIVDFCTVLCNIPLRPGALAHAQVRDYNARLGTLYIRHDKEHAGRTVPVTVILRDIFERRRQGRKSDELLFTMADGRPWTSQTWGNPIKDAAAAAGLPAEMVAYTLRHSIITELCLAGMDLMTLAKIAGTSLEMIQKHYGHLRADAALEAMGKVVAQAARD